MMPLASRPHAWRPARPRRDDVGHRPRLGRAALMVLATVTTNFVNIYMSGSRGKACFQRRGQASIWSLRDSDGVGLLRRLARPLCRVHDVLAACSSRWAVCCSLTPAEPRARSRAGLVRRAGPYRACLHLVSPPGPRALAYYLASPWRHPPRSRHGHRLDLVLHALNKRAVPFRSRSENDDRKVSRSGTSRMAPVTVSSRADGLCGKTSMSWAALT